VRTGPTVISIEDNFTNANLTGANLADSDFIGATLTGVITTSTTTCANNVAGPCTGPDLFG
jgi:uncharacterized protein YjbI with pentapeptide repeats